MTLALNHNSSDRLAQGWGLRYWIAIGYTVPIVLFTLSAGIVTNKVGVVRQEALNLERSIEVLDQLNNIGFNIQTFSRTVRGYLLDPAPVSRQNYSRAEAEIKRIRPILNEIVISPEQQADLNQLYTLVERMEQNNATLFSLVDRGQREAAINFWKTSDNRSLIEAAVALMNTVRDRERAIVRQYEAEQAEALNALLWTIGLAVGATVIASSLLGWWLVSTITGRVTGAAGIIASSSTEIAATVAQQERTAAQQAASVNETTTTMDELNASSRQSAEQAQAAASGAQKVLTLAEQGTRSVDRTLDGMANLKVKVEAIAEQILHLSEQTSQIGNISGLVSDLANQTNMLALNAAVEAVRAGEHGRGFAVVASEIRKLADQSKRSAERINALVADVQSAINSTVMATDEGTKTVEDGVMLARETSEAFAGMTGALDNVAISSQQISLNAKQQAIAIQQVVEAMTSLNGAAREMAAGISQVKLGTDGLNQAAGELKSIM
jgi:methyl-accepting chemotaxis protein